MDNLPYIIIFVVVVVALFFWLIREVVTWYFKQNEIVNLLRDINEKLDWPVKKDDEHLEAIPPPIDEEPV